MFAFCQEDFIYIIYFLLLHHIWIPAPFFLRKKIAETPVLGYPGAVCLPHESKHLNQTHLVQIQ
jgi:hypothetical protein